MDCPEKPLVTIGIPTFNRADGFLKQALQSALAQSWPRIEIVVADNCSSDRTDELVAEFGDPRIRYFKHSENIGANNNFNFCVEQARGDYFLLLHDDDLIDPDFVETCMNSLDPGEEVGIIRTGTRLIDGNGRVLREKRNEVGGLSTAEFLLGWFDRRTALYMCSTLFHTGKLRSIGGFSSKTNLYQDVVAEVKLAARFGRKDVREVKASFRRHDDNRGSAARTLAWCEDSLYLLDVMCGVVPNKHRASLRKKGIVYFCRKCYRNASGIESPIRRFAAYCQVYRAFGFQYSPISYVCHVKFAIRRRGSESPCMRPSDNGEKEKLRIAFCLSKFPMLSQTFILNQIVGMIEKGHKVDIFATARSEFKIAHSDIGKYQLLDKVRFSPSVPQNYILRLLRVVGLILFGGGMKLPLLLGRIIAAEKICKQKASLRLLFSAVPFLGRPTYDIIHAQFGPLGLNALALRQIGALRGKLITSFRGFDATCRLKNHPTLYSDLFAEGEMFLPVSLSLKQRLIENGCDPHKIVVHHSGIDCGKFRFSVRCRGRDEETRIISVGRLVEKKGFSYAIRAVALVAATGRNITYSIIGDGEERDHLERLVEELGIGEIVTFLGWKTRDELIRAMENAHLLIAPSITAANGAEEGIPNALKEAMALGLPVVSSIHGGVPELIEDGVSGYLVKEKDVDGLAERLVFLHDHPETWSETATAGRRKVEREFDIRKLNAELEEIYRSVARGTAAKGVGAAEQLTRGRRWGTDGIL